MFILSGRGIQLFLDMVDPRGVGFEISCSHFSSDMADHRDMGDTDAVSSTFARLKYI
jgi:hypothetical protein